MSIEYRSLALIQKNKHALAVFQHCGEAEIPSKSIDIDDIKKVLQCSRQEALHLMKLISSDEAAELRIGRRGQPTRLIWKVELEKVLDLRERVQDITHVTFDDLVDVRLEVLIDAIKKYHGAKDVRLTF